MHNNSSIGLKAETLSKFHMFTPFFMSISVGYYESWLKEKELNRKTIDILTGIYDNFKNKSVDSVIVRSSAINEGLKNRGKYLSLKINNTIRDLERAVVEIYTHFYQTSPTSKIALFVQEQKDTVIIGHASNERRITSKKEKWYAEFEVLRDNEFRRWEFDAYQTSSLSHKITYARNLASVKESLIEFCSNLTSDEHRVHIEWLWDGINFWVVQVDYHVYNYRGISLGSRFNVNLKVPRGSKSSYNFEILELIDNASSRWHKLQCVKLFSQLNLPTWEVYTLENNECKQRLISGDVDLELINDIKKILEKPILIRTDIHSSSLNVLSPRTETIYNIDDALEFLNRTSVKLSEEGCRVNDYCFIFHQFILSTSCALAFSKPFHSNTRVDSNWGIIEGLYYYPCDSFEVNLSSLEITSKIRCKPKYVDVDKGGKWVIQDSGIDFDWKSSLTRNQVLLISKYTNQIAKKLNRPVTVMFFISDKGKNGYPEILPWYYGDETPPEETKPIDNVFISDIYRISKYEDFQTLKTKDFQGRKFKVHIKIDIDSIRDINLVKEIAMYLKSKDCVVVLDGSILSHPYYILVSSGVKVRCRDPLETSFKAKRYHKLVRDRIPVYIQSKNEQVNSEKLNPEKLLELLKLKVVEEAIELYWQETGSQIIEEMADVYEVLLGLCRVYGIPFDEVAKTADEKKSKRGGFEEGVFLISTKENSLIHTVKDKDLFNNDPEDKSLHKPKRKLFFSKGYINNLKSTNKVEGMTIPYVPEKPNKTEPIRFLLKENLGDVISFSYKTDGIKVEFSKFSIADPDQTKLFDC